MISLWSHCSITPPLAILVVGRLISCSRARKLWRACATGEVERREVVTGLANGNAPLMDEA
jgi:hypothetical protein